MANYINKKMFLHELVEVKGASNFGFMSYSNKGLMGLMVLA